MFSDRHSDVVGLVPAAGRAKRIEPLPCSKELYPLGFRRDEQSGSLRVKVAGHELLEKFRRGGVTRAYVILRNGKWDIPGYFRDGHIVDMNVAYIVIDDSIGPPDTLDRAYSFVESKLVAFGFPDILVGPDDVFERLLTRLNESDADIVLALYLADDVCASDMVEVLGNGRVHSMDLKPLTSNLHYTWNCAVWTPAFTEFMHSFVARERAKAPADRTIYRAIDAQGDLPVGAVVKAAVENGLRVDGLEFPNETYLDIGSPQNLLKAVRQSIPSE